MKVKVIDCLYSNLEMALKKWLSTINQSSFRIERTDVVYRNPKDPVADGHISYIIYYI